MIVQNVPCGNGGSGVGCYQSRALQIPTAALVATGLGCGCSSHKGMGDWMGDYTAGLMAVTSPSSWGGVISSGNMLQIVGLATVPIAAALLLFGGGSKRGRGR